MQKSIGFRGVFQEGLSGTGSDSGSGSGSGSEDDDGDDAAGAREEPKKKPKAPAKPRASSRSVGGDLLESLEDIVETVTVDRETRTCVLTLSLKLTAPQLLVLELCEGPDLQALLEDVEATGYDLPAVLRLIEQ